MRSAKPGNHLNNHFTNIGQSLAQEIPSSEIDPHAYVNPVDEVFSFQRITVQKVIKLLLKGYWQLGLTKFQTGF